MKQGLHAGTISLGEEHCSGVRLNPGIDAHDRLLDLLVCYGGQGF